MASDWTPSEAEGLARLLHAPRSPQEHAVRVLDSTWLASYVARRTVASGNTTTALRALMVRALAEEGYACVLHIDQGDDSTRPEGACPHCDRVREALATALLRKVFNR